MSATYVERTHHSFDSFGDGFQRVIGQALSANGRAALPCAFVLQYDGRVAEIIEVAVDDDSGLIVERAWSWQVPWSACAQVSYVRTV